MVLMWCIGCLIVSTGTVPTSTTTGSVRNLLSRTKTSCPGRTYCPLSKLVSVYLIIRSILQGINLRSDHSNSIQAVRFKLGQPHPLVSLLLRSHSETARQSEFGSYQPARSPVRMTSTEVMKKISTTRAKLRKLPGLKFIFDVFFFQFMALRTLCQKFAPDIF